MKKAVSFLSVLLCAAVFAGSAFSQGGIPVSVLPEEPPFARSLIGAYKKTMQHEPELMRYCKKYDVDIVLALVIAMYESGGNENLLSSAGAVGLMQVMPSTKEFMKVPTFTEAGVKYIAYLKKMLKDHLKRLDGVVLESKLNSYIIKAYNGGPGRVKEGLIKLETVQYLQGVSIYFNLLLQNREKIDKFARDNLDVLALGKNMTWEAISASTGACVLELKMYNPFLANRHSYDVPKGQKVVYPLKSSGVLLDRTASSNLGSKHFFYTIKPGDILQHLANSFGFTYNDIRSRNGMLLWGTLQPGSRIEVTGCPFLKAD